MQKYRLVVVAVLLASLLAGCGGLALLNLVFKALAAGALVAQVTDFLGLDSDEFTLYFDGYNTGQHPDAERRLNLTGLPAGHHLLTLASDDQRVGFHQHVLVMPDQQLNLGAINPIQGGIISGQVMRRVGNTQVPLANVRVAAVLASDTAAGQQTILPPQDDTTLVMMGFTDASGNYRLGPAQFGDWLVTVAYPAHYGDVASAQVSAGNDAEDVDLLLAPNPGETAPAIVQGTVVRDGGGALSNALVALNLGTPLIPEFSNPTAQPVFAWSSVAIPTSTVGAYTLTAPPGAHELYGFKYGFRAEVADVELESDQVVTADISLQAR